ncbi:MAG: hypothetical protein KAU35_08425 [candidate division Zixibacteria bacterium]|nr:hypothetical protein [candidate division Zixibacteria bacterium]
MNGKPHLIIPDADVVIDLHALGLWDSFVEKNNVYLADTVVGEARFYPVGRMQFSSDPNNTYIPKNPVDLTDDIDSGKITIIALNASDMIPLLQEAQKMGAHDRIHPGEEETLAAVFTTHPELTLCFKDRGAVECAVLVGLKDKCISVECALQQCGLGRKLAYGLSEKRFRRIVKAAEQERVQKL